MSTGRFVVSGVAVAALASVLLTPAPARGQATAPPSPHVPTVDELVELGGIAAPTVSPDGRWIAYEETLTDWDRNAFVAQVFVVDTKGGTVVQLTRGKTPAGDLEWSPDSHWITFLRTVDDKTQVHAIRPDGGEAHVLTTHDAASATTSGRPTARPSSSPRRKAGPTRRRARTLR